jgi:hypothetical protein
MNTSSKDKLLVCKFCTHYYITYDVSFRYGCRALGFKSQKQPILEVIETSGADCQFFNEKRGDMKKF